MCPRYIFKIHIATKQARWMKYKVDVNNWKDEKTLENNKELFSVICAIFSFYRTCIYVMLCCIIV